MMSEKSAPSSTQPESERYRGFLRAAVVLAVVGLLVSGVYGYIVGSYAIMALALQSAIVGFACWLCLDMIDIREIDQKLQQAKAEHSSDFDIHRLITSDYNYRHDRHYQVFNFGTLLFGSVGLFLLIRSSIDREVLSESTIPVGLACIIGGIVWAVFAKSFSQVPKERLPEGPGLTLVFREAQWSGLLVGVIILIFSSIWEPLQLWAGRLVLIWLTGVLLEQLVRGFINWRAHPNKERDLCSPLQLISRETLLARGNPISSIAETLERQFGLSLRSSWAIRFVKIAGLFLFPLLLLLCWSLSSVVVVGSNQMAVLKSFGRVSENPLKPGLHLKMPWPFGEVDRYPVKTVNALQVGFVDPEFSKRKALLWSKAHGQEFNLVLGNAVDLVTINMILYYKIHEDTERFFDYALQNQNPVEALETYSYRALMEYTQTSTLKEVMAVNRAKFATNLENAIRDYAEKNRLGIELIEVALINIHPPVEVSPAYLDVISAEIDAKRNVVQAEGYSEMRLHQTEQESYTVESQARIQRARRIGLANKEAMEFRPLSEARSIDPDAYSLRLWFETWENALIDRRLLLIDKSLANDSGNFFLDLRSIKDNASRNLDPLKSEKVLKP